MKKLKLFALGLLSASTVFMTSCEEDPDDPAVGPILTVTESTTGITDGKITVAPGSTLNFEWEARKGDTDLDEFSIAIDDVNISGTTTDGNELPYSIKNADDELYKDGIELSVGNNEGTKVYSFEVTDKNGLNKVVNVTVEVKNASTPLSAAAAFTWERQGSAAGTGLAQFGLKWTKNTTTNAIIAEDAATVLVELNASAWTSITTREGLVAAINGATPITEYTGISVTQDKTYDVVLATMNGSDVYLIHITDGDVNTGGTGTTVTVTGMYKM